MKAAGADLQYDFKRILPVNEQIQYLLFLLLILNLPLLELSFVIIRHFFLLKTGTPYLGAGPETAEQEPAQCMLHCMPT